MKYPHLKMEELPYGQPIRKWLDERYGGEEAERIWEAVCRRYEAALTELPDYGGKKNPHAKAIYGGLLIFSLYPELPDQPPIAELQDFVQRLFMGDFTKLGRVFDLNRSFDMGLIDKVFTSVGDQDRKQIQAYPESFCNVSEPYDKAHHAARYRFTQCPNAEYAKKHDLLHVLPLLCNSDFFGISEIHGQLIREGTCGNSDACDYCVVGNENPMAKAYVVETDENGFLVSRKKA